MLKNIRFYLNLLKTRCCSQLFTYETTRSSDFIIILQIFLSKTSMNEKTRLE